MNSAEQALPSGRLNGWKEIAAFLGKSVRTVQRWEKELGLPTHRIHTSRGEIVWTLPEEIQAWLARTETARTADVEPNGNGEETAAGGLNGVAEAARDAGSVPGPATGLARWRWWQVALACVGLLVAGGALWAVLQPWFWSESKTPARATGQPATTSVANDRLMAIDENKRLLWEYQFTSQLAAEFYAGPYALSASNFKLVEDIDGDGKNEVLFIAVSLARGENELYVFNFDGTLRFKRRPGRSVQYPEETHSPPFLASGVRVFTGPDGKKTLWLTGIHNAWFSSVVEKLAPDGTLLGEYWSNGHINKVEETTWDGRKVVLVAAMHNDAWRTSLAALDYENPNGSAPAENAKYRCDDCPAGEPLLFYVFPRMEISRVLDVRPRITTLRPTPAGDILVAVEHAGPPLPGETNMTGGGVFYTFDANLKLKSAEAVDTYRVLHGRLALLGSVKHPYGAGDDAELFPVLRWDGKKFVPLAKPAESKANVPATPNLARK